MFFIVFFFVWRLCPSEQVIIQRYSLGCTVAIHVRLSLARRPTFHVSINSDVGTEARANTYEGLKAGDVGL